MAEQRKETSASSSYEEKFVKDIELKDIDPYGTYEKIVDNFFKEHAGPDGKMDNRELDAFFAGWKKEDMIATDISQETSAVIAAIFDEDDSRQLSVVEGRGIGALSFFCDERFKIDDTDESKSLNESELRVALTNAGFKPSDTVLKHLISRYLGSDNKITYNEFFLMVSKIRYVIRKFEKLGGSSKKSVTLSLEDLLEMCVKL